MHFLAVFELMSDSLTAIYVEPHQCPSHQSILLTQGFLAMRNIALYSVLNKGGSKLHLRHGCYKLGLGLELVF